MFSIDTASKVEWLQLAVAVFGAGLTFWRLWMAVSNGLAITSTASTDLRRNIAETQVIGELFRMFMQGCLVAVGGISVLLPPPDGIVASAYVLQSDLTRLGMITITIAMAADSFVQEIRRRKFLSDVRAVVASQASPTVPQSAAHAFATDRLDRMEDVRSSKAIHELETENERRHQESQTKIAEGTQAAHAAYEEANTVNRKLEQIGLDIEAKRIHETP